MKILVEVVATNMETGHVAISQKTVDVGYMPKEHEDRMFEGLKKSGFFVPKKVGPILIDRSFLCLCQ